MTILVRGHAAGQQTSRTCWPLFHSALPLVGISLDPRSWESQNHICGTSWQRGSQMRLRLEGGSETWLCRSRSFRSFRTRRCGASGFPHTRPAWGLRSAGTRLPVMQALGFWDELPEPLQEPSQGPAAPVKHTVKQISVNRIWWILFLLRNLTGPKFIWRQLRWKKENWLSNSKML